MPSTAQHTAQVQVSIAAPLAFDNYNIPPDGQERTLDVLANDPFWPGYAGARQITAVSVGSAGGTIDDRRRWQVHPLHAARRCRIGEETFIYVVDELYPAQVTIEIPETLKHDQFEFVQHDPPATLNVLANDPFWPGYSGARQDHARHHQPARRDDRDFASDGQSIIYTQPADFGESSYSSQAYGFVQLCRRRHLRSQRLGRSPSARAGRLVSRWTRTAPSFFYNVTLNDTYRDLSNHVARCDRPRHVGHAVGKAAAR